MAGFLSETALRKRGFTGWVPLQTFDRRGGELELPGVYVVSYAPDEPIQWPEKSCGGFHKGRNPTVPSSQLKSNWVAGAEIVYIGMSTRRLRQRLREFARFGCGEPAGHYGGRLVWQLPDPSALNVAWRGLPDTNPVDAKRELIEEFRSVYGKPPFANDPHKLGR